MICTPFCLVGGAGKAHKMYVHSFANGLPCWVVSSKSFLGVASWLC